MRSFKPAARMLSGAAMAALAACATAPEVPTWPEPVAIPPAAEPDPIAIDRNAGGYPDKYLELEDAYESLPPTGAGAPGIAASRTAFREASRPATPVQDYLPYIDVAIEQDILVAGNGPALQDRYTRIQIVTLDPDSYDVAGVAGDGRKSKKETRDYDK